jgi:hypothetical protein
MNSNQSRQPAGIPEGGRFAGQIHAEPGNLISSNHVEPKGGPVFTEEDLANTRYGKAVQIIQQQLEDLGKSPIWNRRRIKDAREAHRLLSIDYKYAVANPAAKNDKWHRNHPDAPAWAHENDLYVSNLYRELRGFTVMAEVLPRSAGHLSPGLHAADDALSYTKLNVSDQATLSRYFHKHDWHDCKDHSSEWSTYWDVQAELDRIVRQLPSMPQPVTVWRGERYSASEGSDFDGRSERNLARIEYLMSLQPGQPFAWENCAATSLSLDVAANKFSGKRRPEDFRRLGSQHVGQSVSHSVIFELETDRGVFIDNKLTGADHSNENEILLPREMQFEVVGHAQLAADKVQRNDLNTAYHLIKLKMTSI